MGGLCFPLSYKLGLYLSRGQYAYKVRQECVGGRYPVARENKYLKQMLWCYRHTGAYPENVWDDSGCCHHSNKYDTFFNNYNYSTAFEQILFECSCHIHIVQNLTVNIANFETYFLSSLFYKHTFAL